MKNILILLFVFSTYLFSNNTEYAGGFSDAKQCLSCHSDQAHDWQTTWHSKSHYDSNPLYKSVVDYMSKVKYQPKETILVQCAQCHNPTMSVKKIENEDSFALAKVFDVETSQTKIVDDSISDTKIKTGISCVICHRVDKVHESTNLKMRGYEAVEWVKGNVIVGPYDSEERTVFHNSQKREHFVNPNKLCLVCHYGSENEQKIKLYATGEEYNEYSGAEDKQTCAQCHMSSEKKGIIAPQIIRGGTTPIVRNLRSHLFAGARNSDILKNTFSINASSSENDKLIINIKNLTPHSAPTGFSARSIELKIDFLNGSTIIDTKVIKFESTYQDRHNKETLAYLANSLKSDTRIKPYEVKKYRVNKPNNAKIANIYITYRLVNENILKQLGLKDPIFTKEYPMNFLKVEL